MNEYSSVVPHLLPFYGEVKVYTNSPQNILKQILARQNEIRLD